MLIFNRIKILEPPEFKNELVSSYHDSFILHLRKCIIGILKSWLENRKLFPVSQNHIFMANNFLISTLNYLQKTYPRDQSQELINTVENIQLELQS